MTNPDKPIYVMQDGTDIYATDANAKLCIFIVKAPFKEDAEGAKRARQWFEDNARRDGIELIWKATIREKADASTT